MKKDLSTVELHHLVREFQALVGSRVENIYQSDDEVIFSLHRTAKGKALLRISPRFAWLSGNKPALPERPPEFCSQLRRRLEGLKLTAVRQLGGERIIEAEFTGKEDAYTLFIELFGSGNVILCDADHGILVARVQRKFAGRALIPHQHYLPPPTRPHLADVNLRQLGDFVAASKENISKTLATLGLGGTYAAEACLRAGVDLKAAQPSADELARLHAAIKELFAAKAEPRAYLKDGTCVDITPFPFQSYAKLQEQAFPTFSAALDAYAGTGLGEERKRLAEERYQRQREKLEVVLRLQEKHLLQIETEAAQLQKQGEWVYEHYQDVKALLEKAASLRKQGGEAFLTLLNIPGVVKVSEEKGTVTIDTDTFCRQAS